MLKTPDYVIDDEAVYPPAEDTFILLDALERDIQNLLRLKPALVVEIGSGSGVVSAFMHKLLAANGSDSTMIMCIDINPTALKCTRRTMELNGISLGGFDLLNCDMTEPLSRQLKGNVDVLLFNPPYVPSEQAASSSDDFYYAGGADGRVAIDRALEVAAEIITTNGAFYMVALKANKIKQLREFSRTKFQLNSEVVLNRICGIEELYVLKFMRQSS